MIKQDYIVRMIQEIMTALVNEILKRNRMKQSEWEEYDHLTTQILGCTTQEMLGMNAAMLIDRHKDDKERVDKLELAALYLIKVAEEMKGESIVHRSKLYQEALQILVYLQEHSNSYSLTRLQIIQMLSREGIKIQHY